MTNMHITHQDGWSSHQGSQKGVQEIRPPSICTVCPNFKKKKDNMSLLHGAHNT